MTHNIDLEGQGKERSERVPGGTATEDKLEFSRQKKKKKIR